MTGRRPRPPKLILGEEPGGLPQTYIEHTRLSEQLDYLCELVEGLVFRQGPQPEFLTPIEAPGWVVSATLTSLTAPEGSRKVYLTRAPHGWEWVTDRLMATEFKVRLDALKVAATAALFKVRLDASKAAAAAALKVPPVLRSIGVEEVPR